MRQIVLSLYDYTGEAVRPWAMAGYECHCYDIQHEGDVVETYPNGGMIRYLNIAPRDAYPKKTCLWTGNGFNMPYWLPVPVEEGYSRQHKKLGGKSMCTKNIRSATPRGFALAVFEANAKVTA